MRRGERGPLIKLDDVFVSKKQETYFARDAAIAVVFDWAPREARIAEVLENYAKLHKTGIADMEFCSKVKELSDGRIAFEVPKELADSLPADTTHIPFYPDAFQRRGALPLKLANHRGAVGLPVMYTLRIGSDGLEAVPQRLVQGSHANLGNSRLAHKAPATGVRKDCFCT